MKHKGGYIKGSIYVRKHKDRKSSYTAEIQFQGRKLRRSNTDKYVLQDWVNQVCEAVNSHLDAYNSKLALLEMQIRKELYDELMRNVEPILTQASQYDLTNKRCADNIGLTRTDKHRTYLVFDEATGYTKIGKSKDIHTRMQALRTHAPQIQLIGYIESDVEKELHEYYSGKRIKGEWFSLDDIDVQDITNKYSLKTGGGDFYLTPPWLNLAPPSENV